MSLCLVMMLWIVRARLSVPPPGPAVAMNSSGFVGFHSAAAIWGARSVAAPASAARVNFTDMFRSRDFSVLNRANSSPAARVRSQMLRASSTSTSRHLLPVEFGPVGDHGALLLERRDLVGAEAVLGQDLGRVLAEHGRGLAHLAWRVREFHREADRLHGPGGR